MTIEAPRSTVTVKARTLVNRALVWDNHACMPLRPGDPTFLPQLRRHADAGTNVLMLNVGFGEDSIESHIRMIASFRDWLAKNDVHYRFIETTQDIETARECGQMAIGFDIEGAGAIGDQLSLIRLYYLLGVRWMLLAYNGTSLAGGGCQIQDTGLTEFGRDMLLNMAEVGMVACCSHTGYTTSRDAIEVSPTPVIFSHSNARFLHDHPRNIPDDLIRSCAARGGVIGISGVGIFLGKSNDLVSMFARHVVHVAELVGVEHVGIGMDYVFDSSEIGSLVRTNPALFPSHLGYGTGMRMLAPEQIPEIAEALLMHGFTDAELTAVLGGNWMRVAKKVWKS